MDYCKGRAEKRRVSHGSLPVTASAHFLTGLTPKSSAPHGPDKGGLSTSKGFPKPLSERPPLYKSGLEVFKYQILRGKVRDLPRYNISFLFSD